MSTTRAKAGPSATAPASPTVSTATRSSIGIGIENLENRPVPAGLGLHPFFVRDADAELACRTRQVWLTDAEVLPIGAHRRAAGMGFREVAQGRRGHGRQRLRGLGRPRHDRRPQCRASSRDGGDGAVPRLIIYIPPGQPYFCVEPVSHIPGEIGSTRLAPGATLAGQVTFRLSNL